MIKLAAVMLGVIMCNTIYAQNDTAILLQDVMVTATRNKQTNLLSPYSVSKLSTQDIQQFQTRTSPEALVGTAGVFVQKTNHGGGSPFVRSLTGNQNLLMIDGIRLNNATYRYGPNQYFNTIDLFSVGAIEVARGTGSVQYGSDAMGGVIQVFTKDPQFSEKPKWSGNIIGRVLSNDAEYSGRTELVYSTAKTALQVGYTSRKFGDLPGGDTTGIQHPSGYKENALDIKFKWQLNSQWLLTAAHQQLQQNNVPLYHRVVLENFAYYQFDPQKRSLSYLRMEGKTQHPLLFKLSFTASSQVNKERRNYRRNGNANRFIEDDWVNTVGLTADVFSVINSNWTANSGVEFYADQVTSSKQQIAIANGATVNQRGLYPNNARMQNFSLYSLHHFALGKFNAEVGVRYNGLQIEVDTAIVKPSSLVFNAALLYQISKTQSVYASYSTGYRAPNIDDMGTLGLVDFRYEVPAYGLKPEKTFNTELGYKIQTKKVQLSMAFYYMHLTNIINRVQLVGQQVGGYNVYIKENNQESFIRGMEYDVQIAITKQLLVSTNGAYSFGQNTSRAEPMRRIPPFNGRTFIQLTQPNIQYSLEYIYAAAQNRLAQGDKDDNRIPKGGTPGFGLLNFHLSTKITGVQFRTGVNNIFNTDYRMHGSGINGMGRNLYISAQFRF
ncbi:TonB-dependent siderophore receptor [Sediminibacterium sp.]|uniref:TonB-dependent receptor plug domain-containing protein n=1 Tax=Sediminibacterium sp. TaxID=1917865 RepID=UPI00273425E3|nr:TonB-dependent receptor [Sediminibacterium sp.]MDP3392753.1 TonB-dependent receptor [Sediminibacterium sp.]MDP3565875.1 TonB-dependent receptor [Sediminibacterium sp.]